MAENGGFWPAGQLSALRQFHRISWSQGGNVGLGGGGDGNVYACPVPPITLTNGTVAIAVGESVIKC